MTKIRLFAWSVTREILHTYKGTREGAQECCLKEGELLYVYIYEGVSRGRLSE